MTKIERRHATVTLNQGGYEQRLEDLWAEGLRANEAEQISSTKRANTRSRALTIAKEYDELLAEAEAAAIEVTVWALSNTEWSVLADEHPPREDDADDKRRGVNVKTFPPALLKASLVNPATDGMTSVQDKVAVGGLTLADLDLSRAHYVKLETGAWNVNVSDDSLGKSSLVSLLKRQRDPDSKQPNDSE